MMKNCTIEKNTIIEDVKAGSYLKKTRCFTFK
ncbi:hypothetical protein BN440_3353 [Erwinia amylovora MR1]|nr:hypothetical protein BN440_3353 [Erwinia amylovora MR1]